MKPIISLLLAVTFLCQAGFGQTTIPVKGRWEYQWIKTDSGFTPPRYTTLNRPAPLQGAMIYNIDSAKLQYSTDSMWLTVGISGGGIYIPPPADYYHLISSMSEVRDTVFTNTCGPDTCVYTHFKLPQFVGLRVRVFNSGALCPESCAGQGTGNGGAWYFDWNTLTGDLYMYSFYYTAYYVPSQLQVSAY